MGGVNVRNKELREIRESVTAETDFPLHDSVLHHQNLARARREQEARDLRFLEDYKRLKKDEAKKKVPKDKSSSFSKQLEVMFIMKTSSQKKENLFSPRNSQSYNTSVFFPQEQRFNF